MTLHRYRWRGYHSMKHISLAAQYNGKEKWEHHRLDVYTAETSRSTGAAPGKNIPRALDWVDQKGLTVQSTRQEGTTEKCILYCTACLTLDGTSASL
jgi:hypothetical protein